MGLHFSDVNVVVQDTHILHNVTIKLDVPRIVCIGANGSGKSTFAKTACGLIPFKGSITNNGKKINKEHIWREVNLCFQTPDQQIIMPSVEEELRFGLTNAQFSDEEIEKKVDYALSVLKVAPKQSCHTLSEGKKRMLCTLSIILLEVKTMFLDEVTTFLDFSNKKTLLNFLESIPQQIVFITQDFSEVKSFSHAFCIHEGKIHVEGDVKNVIKEYKKIC